MPTKQLAAAQTNRGTPDCVERLAKKAILMHHVIIAAAGVFAAAGSSIAATDLTVKVRQGDTIFVGEPGCLSTPPRVVTGVSALQITRDGWVYFVVPAVTGNVAIVRIDPASNSPTIIGTPNVPNSGCADAERRMLGHETLVARSSDRSAWLQVANLPGSADFRLVRGTSGFISPHPGANSISLSRNGDVLSAATLVSMHYPSAVVLGSVDRISSSLSPVAFPTGLCGVVVPVFPDPGASPAISQSDHVLVKAECLGSGLIRFPVELGTVPAFLTAQSEVIAVADAVSTLGVPVEGGSGWVFDRVADGPIFYTLMDDGTAVYHAKMRNGSANMAVIAAKYVQQLAGEKAVAFDGQPTFYDTVSGRSGSGLFAFLTAGDASVQEEDIAVASSSDPNSGRVFVRAYKSTTNSQNPASNAPRLLMSADVFRAGSPQPILHLSQGPAPGCLDNFNLIAAGRSGRALLHTFGDAISSPDGLSVERVRVVDRYSRSIVASVGQIVELGVPGELWTISAFAFFDGVSSTGAPRGPKYLGGNSGGDGRVSLVADDGTVVFQALLQPLSFPNKGSAPSAKWVVFTANPPAACGFADIANTDAVSGADGIVDNGDFVLFFDAFFGNSPLADIANTDGDPLPDCNVDNGDFDLFFQWFISAAPCQ